MASDPRNIQDASYPVTWVRWTTLVYVAFLILHLTTIAVGLSELRMYTKPVLVPTLLIGILPLRPLIDRSILYLWASALGMSWMGDLFLLWESWFIIGLAAFLCAHIFYTWLFLHLMERRMPEAKNKKLMPVIFILTLIYFLFFYKTVMVKSGDLFVPVILYAMAILVMWLSAANLAFQSNKANVWLVTGALLFLFSDSILGYNKFVHANPVFPFLVMLTYGLAQLGLYRGILKVNEIN